MKLINDAIVAVVHDLFGADHVSEISVTRPDPNHGDFATNIGLQLAKPLGRPPYEIAEEIAVRLRQNLMIKEVTVARPGFINIRLSDKDLFDMAKAGFVSEAVSTKVVIETNNPNPFKDLHIGHAYNCIVADTIANMLEACGHEVHRVSYHGDVGLHVGRSMWAILKAIGNDPAKLNDIPEEERSAFMSRMYVEGSKAHAEDTNAKVEIESLAKESFELQDEVFKEVYEICKGWSFNYLDKTIQRLGSRPAEKRYLERDADKVGVKTVHEHVDTVFTKSEGAIIFDGEQYGLHTEVFIASRGQGLYAARDLGLMQLKHQDYSEDKSIIVTGGEQRAYFNVVIKAAELSLPELKGITRNIPTGTVKLSTGKMSSRTGDILNIEWLFEQLNTAIAERSGKTSNDTLIGALRYALLKVKIGSDVIFDINESVSIEGNSGPYLQYAYARAQSILAKSEKAADATALETLDEAERALVAKIGEYSEVMSRAIVDLSPHHLCTYLYELAQTFNRFYENSRIIGDEREQGRLYLVQLYADTLKNGLLTLAIPTPERM